MNALAAADRCRPATAYNGNATAEIEPADRHACQAGGPHRAFGHEADAEIGVEQNHIVILGDHFMRDARGYVLGLQEIDEILGYFAVGSDD